MNGDFERELATVARIGAVPTILEVVCRTTGMGFAAIARVTHDRWVACGVRDAIGFGLGPGSELEIETTICHEVRDHRRPVIIADAADDPDYRDHAAPLRYGFRSYVSMPIVLSDGSFFGTLCAIDLQPRAIDTPETIGMFRLFAELIAFHLDASRTLEESQVDLAVERHNSELREQFIAVLGHDLRNPLASISSGTRMVLKTERDEKSRSILTMMQASVTRMSELIDNVLDFARGRLGDGITLDRRPIEALVPVLEQVIAELRSAHPDREIRTDLAFQDGIDCDGARVGQLVSNLVANALTHGDEASPVEVVARRRDGVFELAVVNAGPPIPSGLVKDLFKPFVRASAKPSQQGLGLGLYISSEIARAHGGTLEASSSPGETRFTFRMPA